ncbi:hypothetical protein [Sphingomonas faeni]|uniref:hypothetical protein n=1 Tax=Sphingomonas faeni TaxID=185950 RepID=UPI00334CE7A5
MPAAAIGAAATVGSGIASGKGAKKAAKIQAEAQAKQTAALQAMYQENKTLMTPTFHNGEAAQTQLQSLLGLGGDPSSAVKTLEATPGYQFAQSEGLNAINANAYASGQGNSGAALKSAMQYSSGLAQQNYNNYAGQLGSVADRGVSAMNGLVSQGNYTTGAINSSTQAGADAASANAAFQGNNLASMIKGVASAGGQAFGSSYGGNATPAIPGPYTGIYNPQNAFSPSGLNTSFFGGK